MFPLFTGIEYSYKVGWVERSPVLGDRFKLDLLYSFSNVNKKGFLLFDVNFSAVMCFLLREFPLRCYSGFFFQVHKIGKGLMLIKTVTIKNLTEEFSCKSLMVKLHPMCIIFISRRNSTVKLYKHLSSIIQVDNNWVLMKDDQQGIIISSFKLYFSNWYQKKVKKIFF